MKFYSLLLLFLISYTSQAQVKEPIEFSEKLYDFGTVKEEDGPILHEFTFVNNTQDSVRILNVKASCGCTTPAWTRMPVPPGETGIIQAQYNPRNRPGRFNKSLTITTDYNDSPIRLFIRGSVDPKPKTIEEELPTNLEGLRVRYKSFNMGRVYTRETPTIKSFKLYNSTDSVLKFVRYESPKHIAVEFEPEELQPGEKGAIKLIYKAAERGELGFANENVTVFTNQPEGMNAKSFSVFATVYEYFPPMTEEEKANAPQLNIAERIKDLGRIKVEETNTEQRQTTFTLTNSGKEKLIIRKLDKNCTCLDAKLSSDVIKSGQSIELKVTLDPEGRRGNQQKSISIYSNDPRNPVQRVTINAYVEN